MNRKEILEKYCVWVMTHLDMSNKHTYFSRSCKETFKKILIIPDICPNCKKEIRDEYGSKFYNQGMKIKNDSNK